MIGSAKTVTLDLYGDNLVEIALNGEVGQSIIENTGTIDAEGGEILITANAAKEAVDNVINMDGIVSASSATVQGGKIILSAGNGAVNVAGKIEASGTDGGSVKITAKDVHVKPTGEITVDGGRGSDQDGDGGTTYVYADNVAIFRGRISGKGGTQGGDGGFAEVSADKTVGYYGHTDLSAIYGKTGTLLIDPESILLTDLPFESSPDGPPSSGVLGSYFVNARAIADTLTTANVDLWATDFIATSSDIDLSIGTGPGLVDTITSHNLNLSAPVVGIINDITLGTGQLNIIDTVAGVVTPGTVTDFPFAPSPVDIEVVDVGLQGRVYKRTELADPAFTTLADADQINTTSSLISVLSDGALIQQAVDFAQAGAEIVVTGNGNVYRERIVIDVENLKLTGEGAVDPVIQAPEEMMDIPVDVEVLQLAALVADPEPQGLITVTASGVNIDPIVFDGAGVLDYGIVAIDAGANGLVSDGNIFRNFNEAGIFVSNTTGGAGSIINNIFEGSSTRGVEIGDYTNGSVLDISFNMMGSSGDELFNGILGSGNFDSSDITVAQNTVNSTDDGLHFDGTITDSTVTIGGTPLDTNVIRAGLATPGDATLIDGIYFGGEINGESMIDISSNDIDVLKTTGGGPRNFGDMGVRFDSFINTDEGFGVNISDNLINAGGGKEDRAITFVNGIGGNSSVTIDNNVLIAGDDGIGIFDNIDTETNKAIRENSRVRITNNTIGTELERVGMSNTVDGNGLDFERVMGTSQLVIDGNSIFANNNAIEFDHFVTTAYAGPGAGIELTNNTDINALNESGIKFVRRINGSSVLIADNNDGIFGSENGVTFVKEITNSTLDINGNIIHGDGDGIHFADYIEDSDVTIGKEDQGNTITAGIANDDPLTTDDGIYFGGDITGDTKVLISFNDIDAIRGKGGGPISIGDMGIRVDGFVNTDTPETTGVFIENNSISGGRGKEDRGIAFFNGVGGSSQVTIAGNDIEAADDGIGFFDIIDTNLEQAVRDNAVILIQENEIGTLAKPVGHANSDGNGIDFESVTGTSKVTIDGNNIFAEMNGIEFDEVANTEFDRIGIEIINNTNINSEKRNGVVFEKGISNANVLISNNNDGIFGARNGVAVFGDVNDTTLDIQGNIIEGTQNGILIEGDISESMITIAENTSIVGDNNNGIQITDTVAGGGSMVTVEDNPVVFGDNHGILIEGANSVLVDGNVTIGSVDDTIKVIGRGEMDMAPDMFEATISNNITGLTSGDGIEAGGFDTLNLIDNTVSNALGAGIHASQSNNGDVTMSGNVLTDNTVGALFESGNIDLLGDPNIITGGNVGLRFAPAPLSGGGFAPMTLVNDGNPSFGGSIGEQFFSGQSLFFVELDNGAFFDPGTPTVLNGLNSTYDTPDGLVTPSDTAGALTATEFSFIDGKIFDFIDDNTLGLFFFGSPPVVLAVDIDEEDFIRSPDVNNTNFSGLNLTVLGLPNVPGGPGLPGNLNNIETFAGGPAPEGGFTPEQLNNIATASGGENTQNAGCWPDIPGIALGGQIANIGYNDTQTGSFLNSIADCSNL